MSGLRETMVQAAAAKYGQEHYRGILFLRWLSKAWGAVLAILFLLAIAAFITFWSGGNHPTAESTLGPIAGLVLAALVILGILYLLVRRARSPYRRRRFRL